MDRRDDRPDPRPPLPEQTRKWGNVARRGARLVGDGQQAPDDQRDRERAQANAARPAPMDRWERVDATGEWADDRPRVRGKGAAGSGKAAGPGAGGSPRPPSRRKPLAPEVATAIRRAADTATARHREVLVTRMEEAIASYDRSRFQDASRLANQVSEEAPSVPAVRELAGLAAYRAGRWRAAVKHLNLYRDLTGDDEHVPVVMDSQRALGHHTGVARLWTELRQNSPGPDVLAEARMVAAGSLADQRDLQGAIALLTASGAAKMLRNPGDRHLRQWYALADLYERAGDIPKARELFMVLLKADPEAYDVGDRLEALGPERSARARRPARPARSKATQAAKEQAPAGAEEPVPAGAAAEATPPTEPVG